MKHLYHLTRRNNLDSIMKHGLVPGFSRGITRGRRNDRFVFLTDDIRVPVEQLGSIYSSKGWVVLEVNVNRLNVVHLRTTGLLVNVEVPHEFVVENIVSPEGIKEFHGVKPVHIGVDFLG